MRPKLFQYTACPFCSKVAAILAYKKVDYEKIEVHPFKKTEIAFSKDYRAVPIYIDGAGIQINDSTPIMRHIDKEFPNPPVFSNTPNEKIKEDKWLAWSEQYVQGLPTIIYDRFSNSLKGFEYFTKVGKFGWFESRMVQFSGAFVMTLVAKKIAKRLSITNPQAFLRKMIHDWVEGLAGENYMGGTKPNAADLAVFGVSRSIAGLPAGKILRENGIFDHWFNRMAEQTGLSV